MIQDDDVHKEEFTSGAYVHKLLHFIHGNFLRNELMGNETNSLLILEGICQYILRYIM